MNTLKQLQEKGEEEFRKIGCTCECCDQFPTCTPRDEAIDFLHQQTTLAYNAGKAEAIAMCIETIKQSRTVDENYCFGLKEETARKQAVIDLKVKITDKEQIIR